MVGRWGWGFTSTHRTFGEPSGGDSIQDLPGEVTSSHHGCQGRAGLKLLCLIGPGWSLVICIFLDTPDDSNRRPTWRSAGKHKCVLRVSPYIRVFIRSSTGIYLPYLLPCPIRSPSGCPAAGPGMASSSSPRRETWQVQPRSCSAQSSRPPPGKRLRTKATG